MTAPAAPTIVVNDADDDGKINASGTAEPGSTVTVTWPDGSTSTVTANASGNWSVESPNPQGSGTVTVTATDPSGNVSPPATATADMDAPTRPTIVVDDGDDDGRINASGTAEPGSTVTVTWPNGSTSTVIANASGNWSVESPNPQGSGTVTATATDASGNVSPPAAATADMTAPGAPSVSGATDNVGTVIGPITAGGVTDDTQPTFAGTSEAGATINVYDNGVLLGTTLANSSGNWSFTPSAPLSSGSHAITVTATDTSGNISPASGALQFSVDTSAPGVPTIVVNDGDDDGMINASGTAEPGSTVTVTWPDGSTSTVTADGSGSWSVESPTAQATGTVTAVATDASGNASAPVTATADMDAPGVPTIVVNDGDDDGMINASGTAEPGSTVTVTWPDGSTSTVTADGSGSWSVEIADGAGDRHGDGGCDGRFGQCQRAGDGDGGRCAGEIRRWRLDRR